jgi:hypothetical protein
MREILLYFVLWCVLICNLMDAILNGGCYWITDCITLVKV